MKSILSTFVILAAANSFAATTTTTAPATTGTSTVSVEEVKAEKSDLSVKLELWNEKSQAAIDSKAKNFSSTFDVKVTKKLSDSTSVRGVIGASATVDYDNNETVDDDLIDAYVQYSDSKITNIAGKDLAFTIRGYAPTSKASQDGHLIIPQIRAYLSTDFKLTEKLTVTPILNPRAYVGDSVYRSDDSNEYARMYYILETSYAFNDTFSWTTDLMNRNHRNHAEEISSTNIIDTWVSTNVGGGFSVDMGLYNIVDSHKNFNKKGNNYYVNLFLSL